MGKSTRARRTQEKITAINGEVKELYAQIMANKNMSAYNDAKNEVDGLVDFVMQILRGASTARTPTRSNRRAADARAAAPPAPAATEPLTK